MADDNKLGPVARRLAATQRVLCVEDEPDIADFLRAYFRAAGYDLVHVDPDDVRRGAGRGGRAPSPTCVLLDIGLRGFSGLEAYRRLRSDERWAFMPVIMVSADTTADPHPARRKGLDAFVAKPFNTNVLADLVRDRLDGRGASSPTAAARRRPRGHDPGLPRGPPRRRGRRSPGHDGTFSFGLVRLLSMEAGRRRGRRRAAATTSSATLIRRRPRRAPGGRRHRPHRHRRAGRDLPGPRHRPRRARRSKPRSAAAVGHVRVPGRRRRRRWTLGGGLAAYPDQRGRHRRPVHGRRCGPHRSRRDRARCCTGPCSRDAATDDLRPRRPEHLLEQSDAAGRPSGPRARLDAPTDRDEPAPGSAASSTSTATSATRPSCDRSSPMATRRTAASRVTSSRSSRRRPAHSGVLLLGRRLAVVAGHLGDELDLAVGEAGELLGVPDDVVAVLVVARVGDEHADVAQQRRRLEQLARRPGSSSPRAGPSSSKSRSASRAISRECSGCSSVELHEVQHRLAAQVAQVVQRGAGPTAGLVEEHALRGGRSRRTRPRRRRTTSTNCSRMIAPAEHDVGPLGVDAGDARPGPSTSSAAARALDRAADLGGRDPGAVAGADAVAPRPGRRAPWPPRSRSCPMHPPRCRSPCRPPRTRTAPASPRRAGGIGRRAWP